MGRGKQSQALATDQFAAVMGNRRGLRPEQVANSSIPDARVRKARQKAPQVPFSRQKAVASRRMALLSWWLAEKLSLRSVAANMVCRRCDAYREMFPEHQGLPEKRRRLQDSLLASDLAELAKQGVYEKSSRGGMYAHYSAKSPEEWPDGYREAFSAAGYVW
jgi:hypothetical protein